MAIRSFDFYEFVGVLIPGVLFLFGLGLLFPDTPTIEPLIVPHNLGEAALHVILAYAVGHLIQAVGSLFDSGYWRIWRGMPTDWPVSRKLTSGPFRGDLTRVVERASGVGPIKTRDEWRTAVGKIRTRATADGLTSRLAVFNGNYAMFRGIVAAALVLMFASPFSCQASAGSMALVLAGIVALATYRMHRFARHYASEFLNCARILADTEVKECTTDSTQVG